MRNILDWEMGKRLDGLDGWLALAINFRRDAEKDHIHAPLKLHRMFMHPCLSLFDELSCRPRAYIRLSSRLCPPIAQRTQCHLHVSPSLISQRRMASRTHILLDAAAFPR